jgi:long-chain acyl-CoA synthetase
MIIDKILLNCDLNPEKTAIYYGKDLIKYDMLRSKINEYSEIIKGLGTEQNEPIGIVFDNEPEIIFWTLALFKSGNPAALLPVYFKKNEIKYHINCLNLRYFVVQSKYMENYANMSVETEFNGCALLIRDSSLQHCISCNSEDRIIQFTSGSQGESKAVARTESALLNEIISLENPFAPVETDAVFLPLSPLFHSYGLVGGTLFPLYYGLSVALADIKYPKYILSQIGKLKVSHMFVTPFIYKMFCEILKTNKNIFDLSSVKKSFSAGGAIELETASQFKELSGIDIFQNYGSTEAGTMAIGKQPLTLDYSIGCMISDAVISIMPLEFIEQENYGELLIKSDIIDFHYLYPEKLNVEKFYNGLFRTGDIVKKENNVLYYMGRSDSMININGLKVYANEIENIIKEIEGVSEVSIISISEGKDDEMKAYVVLNNNADLTENSIKQYCKKFVADYKIPRKIEFIDSLPKNSSGKILKKYLIKGEE